MKCPSSKRARDLEEQEREEQKKLREERKSPFSRFYQINKDNSDYLRSCLDVPKWGPGLNWRDKCRCYVPARNQTSDAAER